MEISDFETELDNLPHVSHDKIYLDLIHDFEKSFVGTYVEIMAHREDIREDANKEYNRQYTDYCKEKDKILNKFEKWLSTTYGTHNLVIDHLCYVHAWDNGCSDELVDVTDYYKECIEFAQSIIDAYKKENK